MPNWEAIQKDFDNGMSLRSLELKYTISKSVLGRRLVKREEGQYRDSTGTMGQGSVAAPAPATTELAQSMIGQLAVIAKVPLDLKEHNLLANALSQYNKIVVTSVTTQSATQGIDWSIFTQDELDIITPIHAQAEERARIKAGESGIPQLRRFV